MDKPTNLQGIIVLMSLSAAFNSNIASPPQQACCAVQLHCWKRKMPCYFSVGHQLFLSKKRKKKKLKLVNYNQKSQSITKTSIIWQDVTFTAYLLGIIREMMKIKSNRETSNDLKHNIYIYIYMYKIIHNIILNRLNFI